ncbi:hypothetical protein AB1Y20_020396 [Prymnesium parvum]|uniref:Uncharacterized protein n=1 Tax=Prymnesium parvum TaxID=97485 RepID=A0AB34JXV6_PRYPA
MRPAYVLPLTLALAQGRSVEQLGGDMVDFCVSSRWGFSCLGEKAGGAGLRIAGSRITATGIKLFTARSMLAAATLLVAREIIRDVRTVSTESVAHVILPNAVAPTLGSTNPSEAQPPVARDDEQDEGASLPDLRSTDEGHRLQMAVPTRYVRSAIHDVG